MNDSFLFRGKHVSGIFIGDSTMEESIKNGEVGDYDTICADPNCAKSVITGKWLYGLLSYGEDGGDDNFYIQLMDDGEYREVYERTIDKSTIGQCTGRRIKDNRLVFDGDVCKSIDGTFIVWWDKEKYAFIMHFIEDGERLSLEEMWDNSEVIGNVHDCPEWLELIS